MGFFKNIFKRTNLQKPSDWLLYGLSSNSSISATGVNVSEDTCLSYSAVWSAILQLSQASASLPLHLYRRLDNDSKERQSKDQLNRLLHLQPNPEMTAMLFREFLHAQCMLHGTSYSFIERDGRFQIKYLWPLLTANIELKRSENNSIFYQYRLPDGQQKVFQNYEVLRLTGFSRDGILGHNPIKIATEAIGLGMAQEEYQARFFSNNAKPPAVLEHPGQLGQAAYDRLKKSIDDTSKGLSNAHKMMILEEGMKVHEYGVKPVDAQALESRQFQINEVARIFNLPPHMLKDLSRATFSNIEMQSIEFVIYSLRPWLIRFEQAYNTQLIPSKNRDDYFFEHSIDGLLRGDSATRNAAYATGRQWGWLSANDIRKFENMNPVEGGDIYLTPSNMIPTDKVDEFYEQQKTQTKEEAPKEEGKENGT